MSDDQTRRGLRLDGALTLPAAEAVRATLLEALDDEAAVIEVDCEAASEVDLSFIQLMLAARRTAANRGKSLVLAAPASGALREALQRGGLIGEAGDAPDAAFWIGGGDAP